MTEQNQDSNPRKREAIKTSSLWRDAWKRLFRNKLSTVGFTIMVILILTAAFADCLASRDPWFMLGDFGLFLPSVVNMPVISRYSSNWYFPLVSDRLYKDMRKDFPQFSDNTEVMALIREIAKASDAAAEAAESAKAAEPPETGSLASRLEKSIMNSRTNINTDEIVLGLMQLAGARETSEALVFIQSTGRYVFDSISTDEVLNCFKAAFKGGAPAAPADLSRLVFLGNQSMRLKNNVSPAVLRDFLARFGTGVYLKVSALIPYDYDQQIIADLNSPPSLRHLLGTDNRGRDILCRIIHGSRISLEVGIISQVIALSIGVVTGIVSGYYRGTTDMLLMRVTDVFFAFPFLLFVMTIVAVSSAPSVKIVFLAMGFVGWPGYARIIRSQVLSLREKEFVEAIKSLGASDWRIIFLHILPNTMAPIIVQLTIGMAGAVLAEAGLSYLGMGAQPPTPSWGLMVADTQEMIAEFWWMSIYPGVAIMLAVYGFNLFGDGLRDALDPRLK